MQRFQRLFNRRVVIEAMDLIEVDVIRAQPAQAVVDGVHDVFAREALLIRIVAHGVEDFGGDHHTVPRWAKFLKTAAQDLFTHAQRIHVGRVEEVDA